MAFLKAIDTILSQIALVRWALVISLVLVIITNVVLFFQLKGGELQIANLKINLAQTTTSLELQNQKIQEMGAEADAQRAALQQATKKASQIALDNKKLLEKLGKIELKGTCDEKVKQTLGLINTSK